MIASFFHALFMGIWTLVILAAIGGAGGVACYFVGRLLAGFKGAAAAFVIGAVLMVGAHVSGLLAQGASDRSAQKLADAQAQAAKLEHDLAAQQDVANFQQEQAAAQAKRAETYADELQSMQATIDKHANDTDCISPDELSAIRAMK